MQVKWFGVICGTLVMCAKDVNKI